MAIEFEKIKSWDGQSGTGADNRGVIDRNFEKVKSDLESIDTKFSDVDDDLVQLESDVSQVANNANAIFSDIPSLKEGYTRLDGTFSQNDNWVTTSKIDIDIFVEDFIEVSKVTSYQSSVPSVVGVDENNMVVYTSFNAGSFIISKTALAGAKTIVLNSYSGNMPKVNGYGNIQKETLLNKKNITELHSYVKNHIYGGSLYVFEGYFSIIDGYYKHSQYKATLPIKIEEILYNTPEGIQIRGNASGYTPSNIHAITFVDENMNYTGTLTGGFNKFISVDDIPADSHFVIFNKDISSTSDELRIDGYGAISQTLKEVEDDLVQIEGELANLSNSANAIFSDIPLLKKGYTKLDGTFSQNDAWVTTSKIDIDIFVEDFIEVSKVTSYQSSVPSVVGVDENNMVVYTSFNAGSFIISKTALAGAKTIVLNSYSGNMPKVNGYGNIQKETLLNKKNITELHSYVENHIYGGSLYVFEGYFSTIRGYYKNDSYKATLPIKIEEILYNTPEGIQIRGNTSGFTSSNIHGITFVDENMNYTGSLTDGYNKFISIDDIPADSHFVIFNKDISSTSDELRIDGYGAISQTLNNTEKRNHKIDNKLDVLSNDLYNDEMEYIVGFYTSNGTVSSSSDWKTTTKIIINSIKDSNGNINVSGLYSLEDIVASVCYFDKSGNIIDRAFLIGRQQIKSTDIPEGSYYITFTASSSGNIEVLNYGSNINNINSTIEKIIRTAGNTAVKEIRTNTNQALSFYPYAISKGDIILTRITTEDGNFPSNPVSILLRDSSSDATHQQGLSIQHNNYTKVSIADDNYKGIATHANNVAVTIEAVVFSGPKNTDPSKVYVAASNSSLADRRFANYVCDGVNDEVEIQQAVDAVGFAGTVVLLGGQYYIDEIKPTRYGSDIWCAVAIKNPPGALWDTRLEVKIKGVGARKSNKDVTAATTFIINEGAFDNVPEEIQPNIFGTERLPSFCGVYYSDFRIEFPNSNHKCVGINLEYVGHGISERIAMSCNNQTEMPVEGLVGLRCYHGYSTGHTTELNHIACGNGFYVAFEMGGEHVIANELHARYNYSGYTFGDYNGGDIGTFDHAITMINCCDEKSGRLPQFIDCGGRVPEISNIYPNEEARQSIRMLDFVVELNPVSIWDGAPLIRMKELNPAQFCGYINFTTGGGGRNSRDVQLWENDGSGVNFKTENSTHAKGGTTAERNTYYAQYMQHYYDTDLNKELICIDTAAQKWVDCLGNIIT